MLAGITMVRGAAPLRTPAMRERVTVMVPGTVATMMDTEAARVTSSVAPTTVSSLEPTTIPRYYPHCHYHVIIYNCFRFKDDCCERPQGVSLAGGAGSGNIRQQQFGGYCLVMICLVSLLLL